MLLSPRWKTPGLHTYVSSNPSKIGCKAKYFVDCSANFFVKSDRCKPQIYKLLLIRFLNNND